MTDLYKMVNGIQVPLTDEELTERATRIAEWENDAQNRLISEFTNGIRDFINSIARSKSYDDALSCTSYASSTNLTWKTEADIFIAWRDNVLNYTYNEFEKYKSNTRSLVTLESFINELPAINW